MIENITPFKVKKGLDVTGETLVRDYMTVAANSEFQQDVYLTSTVPAIKPQGGIVTFLPKETNTASNVRVTPTGTNRLSTFTVYNNQTITNPTESLQLYIDSTGASLRTFNTVNATSSFPLDFYSTGVKAVSISKTKVQNFLDTEFKSTGYVLLPSGTTAQRPSTPSLGMMRYNSTLGKIEGYLNNRWGSISGAGTVNWIYTNAQITLTNPGDGAAVDTQSASLNVYLMSNPIVNDKQYVGDYRGTFNVNKCVLKYDGVNKIMGGTDDVEITSKNAVVEFTYIDATMGWKITAITGIDNAPKIYSTQTYVATGGETSVTATYNPGFVQVAVNGVMIDPNYFTASNGTSISFGSALNIGDVVTVYGFIQLDIANVVDLSSNQSIGGVKTFTQSPVLPGNATSSLQAIPKQQLDSFVDDLASSDPAKGAALVGGVTRSVATYAFVRSFTGDAARLEVGGRTNYFEGAHGLFVVDASDTTSADNDATILVDGIGRRWKRQFSGPVNVRWWGALGGGVTVESTLIQAAINYVNSVNGGEVECPTGQYNLGTTGLVIYPNVKLTGDAQGYVNSTRGTEFLYSGTGDVVKGVGLLNSHVWDISIDATASTGTSVQGIYFQGMWLSSIKRVRIKGVLRAKGYGIHIDSGVSQFGSQHNRIEQVECPDGVIRMNGFSATDAVTTTVVDTIRGMQYEFDQFQGILINATAESWTTGAGFDFQGTGTNAVMVGCDIEGSGSPGIAIGGGARVREIGTTWLGFSGAVRVANEAMDTLRSYGGELEIAFPSLTAATPKTIATHGDLNTSYLREEIYPTNVSGGTQEGHRRQYRKIGGSEIMTHELDEHFFIKHSKTTTAATAVDILTVPIASGDGLRISVHAHGTQAGDAPFSVERICVAANNFGTLTLSSSTALATGPGAISFTSSGGSLIVQWIPSTANSSTTSFNFEIRGKCTGYTKN